MQTLLLVALLLHLVDDLIWHPEVLDRVTSDISFWHSPESVTILYGEKAVETEELVSNTVIFLAGKRLAGICPLSENSGSRTDPVNCSF